MPRTALAIAVLASLALTVTGCADPKVGTIGGRVRVVAAENFWGSLARQLGGAHAQVQSLIVNPAQDPHSYEPTTGDARAMATAQLAIVNGVGYDRWASQLLAGNPTRGRIVLDVGRRLGLQDGANPHRWYDPDDVARVARTITADLQRLDPPHKLYFAQRLTQLDARGLAGYHRLIAAIRARYSGVAVGASESIFALQALPLGLDLITPPGFMKAISEGTEVTAQDTVTTERQLADHRIKVWVYNSQNVTPEIQRLNSAARAAGIPTVTVTETLSPASASFQQWQVAQLTRLQAALHQATGR